MSTAESLHRTMLTTTFERLRAASEILASEAATLDLLAKKVPVGLAEAIANLETCRGAVVVTGMGKAGWIGQKISASLASTGTRSYFLHPAEAIHGDLGRVASEDWILALSNSGETEEVTRILPALKRLAKGVIAITSRGESTLAQAADVVIDYPLARETCHLGLAPSNSTIAMLALGDALALVLSRLKQFSTWDFARYHPGGALGRKLATVDEVMRPISQCRVAHEAEIVRDIYVRSSAGQRRIGVILVVDPSGKLAGLFTDSDLARLLERRQDSALDQPIGSVMTCRPITIAAGKKMEEAVQILASRNISELPVVGKDQCPLGIVDITDVIGLVPCAATTPSISASNAN